MSAVPAISRFFGIVIGQREGAHRTLEVIDSSLRRRQLRFGVLWLLFADGLEAELALLERMRGPVFETARTPEGFARVSVDADTGTVTWPGGADLAPDMLYERIRAGAWPEHDIAA